jgi:4-hydroxybenzoyl-CoA thioesterase
LRAGDRDGPGATPPVHTETIVVAWADCDAAGKVFYPNFYVWFDRATEKLFRSVQLPLAELRRQFQIVGMPLLESRAEYRNACLHGAELQLESRVESWSGRTFTVQHRVTHADGRPALCGWEKRVFVVEDAARPAGVRAVVAPEAIIARLGGLRENKE